MTQLDIKRTFNSYQLSFIEEFLAPQSPNRHWLVTTPGAGAAKCVEGIISRVKTAQPHARVLVLSPRPLLLQWFRRLDSVLESRELVEGNRRTLRQLSETGDGNDAIWPAGHVILVDPWIAERFSDLQESVFRTHWDLVVWDAFIVGSFNPEGRLRLLNRLSHGPQVTRLLLISNHARSGNLNAPDLNSFHQTVWDRTFLDLQDSHGTRIERYEFPIFYRRSAAEDQLRAELDTLVKVWRTGSAGMPQLDNLMMALQSSPLAFQELLQRLQPKRMPKLQRLLESEEEDNSGPDEPEQLSAAVSDLLEHADSVSDDSKLEALLKHLQLARGRRVLIVCRYTATARYLRAAISESLENVRLITADLPAADILRKISGFDEEGGILITTGAALQGVDLAVDHAVVYDYAGPWARTGLRPRPKPSDSPDRIEIAYLLDETQAEQYYAENQAMSR